MIALDFETHLIQPGLLAPRIVCGAFYYGADELPELLLRDECAGAVRFAVGSSLQHTELVVGQNIAYDFGCWLAEHPEDFGMVWDKYKRGEVYDIGIAATLNANAEGRLREGELFSRSGTPIGRYSLNELVKEWLGRDNAKEHDEYRLRYAELDGLPLEQWPLVARQYPIDDARNTWEVAKAQLDAQLPNAHLVGFQSHVALALHLSAIWGIRCDPTKVEAFAQEVEARQAELKQRFLAAGLYRYEGPKKDPQRKIVKNTKVVADLVVKAYGESYPRTETGRVSTDRVTLEDSGDELLEALAEVSRIDKQVSYLPALREAAQVPLNVRPNVLLSTGRSSYEGIIQLIPRKGGLRPCFAARPGKVLISVDYSAIELSTLAQVIINLGLKSKLADAINADLDPHVVLASKLNGMPYDAFAAGLKAKDAALKDLRQAGKAANFGFPGMMGAVKFVLAKRKEGSSVCEWFNRDGQCVKTPRVSSWKGRPLERPMCPRCIQQAEHLRHFYAYEAWTEMPEYWNYISAQLEDNDAMRQFGSEMLRGGLHGPSAANNLFQGLAAWGAKHAVLALTEEMYLGRTPEGQPSPLAGARLCIFAHDETIIEADEQVCHEAGYRQAEVMVREMRRWVPDVKVKAEPAAMKNWYKDAEPVFDSKGRLVPWAPKEAA